MSAKESEYIAASEAAMEAVLGSLFQGLLSTLVEYMIVAGVENRPPMLDKTMYNSWQSRMIEWSSFCDKKYAELTEQEKLQDGCDVQALNIVLQGLLPDVYALVNHYQAAKDIQDRFKLIMQGTELPYQEHECKLYNEFDTSIKGESLHEYYLRFS
ncbi:hypothetical protein Tco_1517133 [Tanacetum coccineum]